MFSFLNPYALVLKSGTIVLILGTTFFGGWWVNGNRWEVKYQKLEAVFATFQHEVTVSGERARAESARIVAAALKAKEKADEENRHTRAADRAIIDKLRRDADKARASRSVLPPAPAGSSRPDLICLDRAEYQREDGEIVARLLEGARRLADEGTAATIDLNTAKQWVLKLKLITTLKEQTP